MANQPTSTGEGTAAATTLDPLSALADNTLDADAFCAKLAGLLHVATTEVSLLRLEKGLLRFLHPAELKSAGSIPLSGATVAAHTASSRKSEMFNNFTKVKHASVFETVKLENKKKEDPGQAASQIQKLISTPIMGDNRQVLGVLQVCRKGFQASSVADFAVYDQQSVEFAATVLATAGFMQPNADSTSAKS